jgi:hypothetical protein
MDAHDEKMWVHAVRRHGCMRQEGGDACYEKAGMYAMKRRDACDEKVGMHATKRQGCTQGEAWMHAMRSRYTVRQ